MGSYLCPYSSIIFFKRPGTARALALFCEKTEKSARRLHPRVQQSGSGRVQVYRVRSRCHRRGGQIPATPLLRAASWTELMRAGSVEATITPFPSMMLMSLPIARPFSSTILRAFSCDRSMQSPPCCVQRTKMLHKICFATNFLPAIIQSSRKTVNPR